MNERQEIIILIKKGFFVNGFNHLVDKNKCKIYGRQFNKVDTDISAKRGTPFSLIHATSNYILERIL